MRRRIDCNYIAFLRHVFDKSKYRTRDPRTEKMVREDQAIRLICFIADLAVRGSLDGTFYFEQTFFSVEIKQNDIYESKMQSRLDATVAIVVAVVFQMDCRCLMT